MVCVGQTVKRQVTALYTSDFVGRVCALLCRLRSCIGLIQWHPEEAFAQFRLEIHSNLFVIRNTKLQIEENESMNRNNINYRNFCCILDTEIHRTTRTFITSAARGNVYAERRTDLVFLPLRYVNAYHHYMKSSWSTFYLLTILLFSHLRYDRHSSVF